MFGALWMFLFPLLDDALESEYRQHTMQLVHRSI